MAEKMLGQRQHLARQSFAPNIIKSSFQGGGEVMEQWTAFAVEEDAIGVVEIILILVDISIMKKRYIYCE